MKGDIRITVEKVRVEGNGVILLTGPSGCGKGEVAKALERFLSIPEERHLSMGNILRKTVERAKADDSFMSNLAENYGISNKISIIDPDENKSEVTLKAKSYLEDIKLVLELQGDFVSQFNWLEYCVKNGLLIPDEWTEKIIDALLESSTDLHSGIFILDGYPRTVHAATSLLETLKKLDVEIIKVVHLFITKEQMKIRALNRGRIDDTKNSLERRYDFYIERVQPCIDFLKSDIGNERVVLVDAHQPIFNVDGVLDIDASIGNVVSGVMESLGLPKFLMDLK